MKDKYEPPYKKLSGRSIRNTPTWLDDKGKEFIIVERSDEGHEYRVYVDRKDRK